MADTVIPVPVDERTAAAYYAASFEDQFKIQQLLRLRLIELAQQPRESLQEIMDRIGAEAQARGLTPEILEEILRDD